MSAWRILATVDRIASSEFLDNGDVVSHKVLCVSPFVNDNDARKHPQYLKLCELYCTGFMSATIQPLLDPFPGDHYTSFGVFSKLRFETGEFIPGISGLLADIPHDDPIGPECGFSVFVGEQLLLGPISFVNSCCKPNCVYHLDKKTGILRLKVISTSGVDPGDQLWVKYGAYFGDDNEDCLCPFTECHGKIPVVFAGRTRSDNNKLNDPPQSSTLDDCVQTNYDEPPTTCQVPPHSPLEESSSVDHPPLLLFPSSAGIGSGEANYEEPPPTTQTSSEHLSTESHHSRLPIPSREDNSQSSVVSADLKDCSENRPYKRHRRMNRQNTSLLSASSNYQKRCRKRTLLLSALPALDSDTSVEMSDGNADPMLSDGSLLIPNTQNLPTEDVNSQPGQDEVAPGSADLDSDEFLFGDFHYSSDNPLCSTPLHEQTEANSEHPSSPDTSSDESTESLDVLYEGSRITVASYIKCFQAIATQHCMSDACKLAVLKLCGSICPPDIPNKVPKSVDMSQPVCDAYELSYKSTVGSYYRIDFRPQLLSIVTLHRRAIDSYRDRARTSVIDDLVLPDGPVCEFNKRHYHLILNTDGAEITRTVPNSAWPIWLMIAELPPVLRMSFKNIVLAGLWCGSVKPTWDLILPLFIGDLLNVGQLGIYDSGIIHFFHPYLVIVDAIAKAPLMNIHQFNGSFGCNLCLVDNKNENRRPIYKSSVPFELRTREHYLECVEEATRTKQVVFGVKGPCVLASCLPDLPFCVPKDYMHQALIGVGKMLIKECYRRLNPAARKIVDARITRVRIPAVISRQPKMIGKIDRWNASEIKVFLFYLAPILLKDLLEAKYFEPLVAFSVAIRLLAMSEISELSLLAAARLLSFFDARVVEAFGYKNQSYNVHAIRHFCWQVRRFGPLSSCSAFAFESANHYLTAPLTGTVNLGELMVKRYLLRKSLANGPITDDVLSELTKSHLGIANQPKVSSFTRPSASTYDQIQDHFVELGQYEVCGRFQSSAYGLFGSAAYSREKKRLNSVSQVFLTGNITGYCRIEVFVRAVGCWFALVQMLKTRPVALNCPSLSMPTHLELFVQAERPTEPSLEWIDATTLGRKCLVVRETSTFYQLSPVNEFAEHS